MAGLASNNAWVGFSRIVKGTPAASMQYKSPFTSGNAAPERIVERLQETDNNVDQGVAYLSRFGAAGNPAVYCRDSLAGLLFYAAQGGISTAGSTNYTHTITNSNTLPYLGIWRMLGSVLWEQLNDCQISSLVFRAGAGEPLVMEVNFVGRNAVRLTSVPFSDVPAFDTQSPYTYNEAAVVVGSGGASSTVTGFELTIDNQLVQQQTDDAIIYDHARSGPRLITLSYDQIFETINDYTAFHTGTTSGTTQSTTIYKSPATSFTFTRGANNEIKFDCGANFAWEEYPVEADAAGGPLVVSVRGALERPASGSNLTTTIKNQVASYPTV